MTVEWLEEWVEPSPAAWPAGVHALTTTRRGPDGRYGPGLNGWNLADHVNDDPTAVAANRRLLAAHTGVDRVQWLTQVHGSRCVEARQDTAASVPQADAAWTRERGLGLAVLTADCVPVVVCDRQATLLGVAHGGWRGLVSGVLGNLLNVLPASPQDLMAWLGPAIGPTAYQVGGEVAAAVTALPDGEQLARACLRPGGPGRHYLDLFTLTQQLLEKAGVATVISDRLCTYTDQRFFSYRRDGNTGRMVTLAWLDQHPRTP
jgi:hypothetical protein